jgi:hypothetical protein
MARATKNRKKRSSKRASFHPGVSPELRIRLEERRLELRSLFRALDQLHLSQDLPEELKALMELDADFAEALWVLDQPPGGFNLEAMTRDTQSSLSDLPLAIEDYFSHLSPEEASDLHRAIPVVRATLRPEDAYIDIPGRDPRVR